MNLLHTYPNIKTKPAANRLATRGVSVALTLVLLIGMFTMVMAGVASAAWPQYQGDLNRTGQILNGTPPTTGSGTPPTIPATTYSLYNGVAGASVNVEPLLETISDHTYAYVQYSAMRGGARLEKVDITNPSSPTQVWDVQLSAVVTPQQLSTPYLDGAARAIYCGVTTTHNQLPTLSAPISPGSYSFVYTGTVSTGQLVSDFQLLSGSSATVTFGVYNSTGLVTSVSKTVTSASGVVLVDLAVKNLSPDTYTVTVSVTGGSVSINSLLFNVSSCGIVSVTNIDSTVASSVSVSSIVGTNRAGQINTPITVYDGCIYFGTYQGGNMYYQYNLSTGMLKDFTGYDNFYWAGAYSDGTTVFFGGDGGYLYYLPVATFGGFASPSNTITLPAGAGDVRSSISRNDTSLYFTSKGVGSSGYLWCVNIATRTITNNVVLPYSSTSTPAISKNGYIYVGYYSGPGGSGGVVAVPLSFGSTVTIYSGDAVQASPIVYTAGSVDSIYFTTNVAAGKGYCCNYNVATPTPIVVSLLPIGGSGFALQGFASDNGHLVYGDNSGKLYIA